MPGYIVLKKKKKKCCTSCWKMHPALIFWGLAFHLCSWKIYLAQFLQFRGPEVSLILVQHGGLRFSFITKGFLSKHSCLCVWNPVVSHDDFGCHGTCGVLHTSLKYSLGLQGRSPLVARSVLFKITNHSKWHENEQPPPVFRQENRMTQYSLEFPWISNTSWQ